MEAIPKSDIKSVIKSDIRFDISTKRTTWIGHKSIKSIKRNNTWNIRLLVDDSFVPSSKQPSVLYCKLTDFFIHSFFVLSFIQA